MAFATKYAVLREIKPRILALSIRKRQSNLSTLFIFVSCEEKGYYRTISVGKLGLNAARAASTTFVGVKQIIFFAVFSNFESGGITKHLMTGLSGNIKSPCFPRG